MIRPKCNRCKGPLDIWYEPDDGLAVQEAGRYYWCCNNPTPLYTDEQLEERWNQLDGDDVVKLLKDIGQ